MTSTLLPTSTLSEQQRDQMLTLLRAHFDGVTKEQFIADLKEKNWIILLHSSDGSLSGFSTILSFEEQVDGALVLVIYSGDTIVARDAWGTPALPRAWIAAINKIREQHSCDTCYWLLLTSGFRTYRFLPVFWRDFYPRFDRPTPHDVQGLIDSVAGVRFGSAYDKSRGVVVFPRPQVLRQSLIDIPRERMSDPHIAFFAERNPGYVNGDELVCLCEITETNLTPAGLRMTRKG